MGAVVVDASIAIAIDDANDAHHDAARAEMARARETSDLVLPASAFAEAMVRPIAAGIDAAEIEGPLRAMFKVEPLTDEIARIAARVRATTSLRLPDALVIATGIHLDADEILTCDARWRRVDPRVKVVV